MEKINAELYSYEDLVYARAQEINDRQKHIEYPSYIHRSTQQEPSCIRVCELSEEMVKLGFRPELVYHRNHFEDNMLPLAKAVHGHDVSISDMLSLPRTVNEPVAIIKDSDGLLRFMAADKNLDGSYTYRTALVSPHDMYDGALYQYGATKVITFHNIELEEKFYKMLKHANMRGEILYFNQDRYAALDPYYQSSELLNKVSISTPIRGHFQPRENVDEKIRKSTVRARAAAELTMIKSYDNNYLSYEDHQFTPYENALKALQSEHKSLEQLKAAIHCIDMSCKLVRDREISDKVRELTQPMIAKYYCELAQSPQIIEQMNATIDQLDNMDITGMDVDDVYDIIERADESMLTLKNCGIEFDDKFATHPDIIAARQVSCDIANEASDRLNDIADKHIDAIEAQEETQDWA